MRYLIEFDDLEGKVLRFTYSNGESRFPDVEYIVPKKRIDLNGMQELITNILHIREMIDDAGGILGMTTKPSIEMDEDLPDAKYVWPSERIKIIKMVIDFVFGKGRVRARDINRWIREIAVNVPTGLMKEVMEFEPRIKKRGRTSATEYYVVL